MPQTRGFPIADETSSLHSRKSYASGQSQATEPFPTFQPELAKLEKPDVSPTTTFYPRSSSETYASTAASQEEFYEEPEEINPVYRVPDVKHPKAPTGRSSNPDDFGYLFPSARKFNIRHDETTIDGNMNLRVDTEVDNYAEHRDVQLFHLRMHDLQAREFSLRRYSRDSGREVCHTARKYATTVADIRPALQRSMSTALASIIGKPSVKRTSSGISSHSSKGLRLAVRSDSGYGSNEDVFADDEVDAFMEEQKKKSKATSQSATNSIKLEFSNYSQVEIKRTGNHAKKRYEFEYWGFKYSWRRIIDNDDDGEYVFYNLCVGNDIVAEVVPDDLTQEETQAAFDAGRWVPPCSMWLVDDMPDKLPHDIADVIMATGLIAIVDDCIKRNFQAKPRHHVGLPASVDFAHPKAMVGHMFKRQNSGSSSTEKAYRPSPLKSNPTQT
jgi:hypothetical protein